MNSSNPSMPANAPQSKSSQSWDDHHIEMIVGTLLRAGVLLSASVVLVGGLVYLLRHGHSVADYRSFQGDLSSLRTVPGILHGVMQLSGRAIVQFGLLLLIATPVARVLFSAIAFGLQRDKLYVLLTLMVLAILAYSLSGGSFH
jgi:uncharacterized membrane protein